MVHRLRSDTETKPPVKQKQFSSLTPKETLRLIGESFPNTRRILEAIGFMVVIGVVASLVHESAMEYLAGILAIAVLTALVSFVGEAYKVRVLLPAGFVAIFRLVSAALISRRGKRRKK